MSALLATFIGFIELLLGWRSHREEGSVLGVGVSEGGIVEFGQAFPAEGVLAYTVEDDLDWVYVVKGHEEEAAKTLQAEIDGDFWTFQEDGPPARRQKKEVPPPDIGSPISTVARVVPATDNYCVYSGKRSLSGDDLVIGSNR